MADTAERVWKGAAALEPFLVPIGDLEPTPGNPRRGDVEVIRASLRRFGQVKALVIDGSRIIAHHHVRLAAVEEGWTHIAAIPNEFADEDEARAYLLADNRTADRGTYDPAELVSHLQALAEIDSLPGTGYDTADLDDLLAELARVPAPAPEPGSRVSLPPSEHREVVLMLAADQLEVFNDRVRVLAEKYGTAGVTETVYAALETAVAHA